MNAIFEVDIGCASTSGQFGWAPLHYAIFNGHKDCVETLLKVWKFGVMMKDTDKNLPLYLHMRRMDDLKHNDTYTDILKLLVNAFKDGAKAWGLDLMLPIHWIEKAMESFSACSAVERECAKILFDANPIGGFTQNMLEDKSLFHGVLEGGDVPFLTYMLQTTKYSLLFEPPQKHPYIMMRESIEQRRRERRIREENEESTE